MYMYMGYGQVHVCIVYMVVNAYMQANVHICVYMSMGIHIYSWIVQVNGYVVCIYCA